MRVDLPYVKRQLRERTRPDGTVWSATYYYYRRPGAPDDGARLPGTPDDAEFLQRLKEFNARAEHVPPEHIAGSFAHLVADYMASPDFTDLRDKTRREYAAFLRRMTAILGPFPIRDIDLGHVMALRDRFADKPPTANALVRVLRLLMSWALDRRRIAENPASQPKQLRVTPRRAVWSPEAEAAFVAVADAPMRLAYIVHAYTAQRQGDVLAMTWAQYQGGAIRLRQQKTGTLIEVPAHSLLRAALDAAPRTAVTILTDHKGLPWRPDHFRHLWRRTTLAAGLDGLQNRDLRRTAIVRLGEAGATIPEIAAVSGHSIEETTKILEIYLPRTAPMAAAAIAKWEARK